MEKQNPVACLREEFASDEFAISLNICYNCSTCTTICPVALETAQTTKFNPRAIIQLANCGYEDRLVIDRTPNVFDCAMCELCQEACPEGVNLHGIFLSVKNACAQEINIPSSYTDETYQVFLHGKAVALQPAIAKRREQLGLPPSHDIDEKEIQLLMGMTPAKDILEGVAAAKLASTTEVTQEGS